MCPISSFIARSSGAGAIGVRGNLKKSFAWIPAVLWLAVLPLTCHAAQILEETGIMGEPIQVRLDPNVSNGELIGVKIYTIYKEGDLGTAFFSVNSFYRLRSIPKMIIEDREWFRIIGFQ